MQVRIVKEVEEVFEVPDNTFSDDNKGIDGLNIDQLISYCEQYERFDEYEYSTEHVTALEKLKQIEYTKGDFSDVELKDKVYKITEKDYKKFVQEREKAERCYECSGYGDDYDEKGKSKCDTCPFNK